MILVERSVFQSLEQFINGNGGPKSYRATAKAHANLFFFFKFILLYLEDLVFCIKRAGWKITKIKSHLAFEQARFKQNFVLMNQKLRQESKNNVEKDFYKSMNNSTFGYDCRNNIDNCKFVPIFDEFGEISFINRYHNIFDQKISKFVTPDLIKYTAEEEFNCKLTKLDKEDRFYEINLQTIKAERKSSLEAAEKFEQNLRKNKKRKTLFDYEKRKPDVLIKQQIKSLIDFDDEYSSSIKSVAIENSSKINLTTRFLNGKMLMFSKVSVKSFVYDLIDVFMFPNNEIQKIYTKC